MGTKSMGRAITESAVPDESGAESDARAQRIRTMLLARCQRVDGSEPLVRVRNLSAKGLCGARGAVVDFAVGELLHIAFEGVAPIAASVTWIDGGRMGFAFRNPISLTDLAAARASRQSSPA